MSAKTLFDIKNNQIKFNNGVLELENIKPTKIKDNNDSNGTSGQVLSSTGTALSWIDASSGATAFTGLSDTPSTLGTAGQVVQVNTAGTALEFVTSSVSLTNNSDANFNDVDVNGTLTINDITPSSSTTSSSVPDGTTTLSQTLTSTNQKRFGRQVKITSNSEYIFTMEDVSSGNGPNIYIYKKVNGSYSTTIHQTISTGLNSSTTNTRIDIKPDGSLLAVAQIDPNINVYRVYFYLYYFNSSTGLWVASNSNSNPFYKTWNYSINGQLERVHTFMSPNGQYMAIGNGLAYVSGGAVGDGTVTVFEISGSGSSLSVSEVIEFTRQNNGNLRLGSVSHVGISNNGYVIALSDVWNGSYGVGTIYLYKIDFTANPVTATLKYTITNPTSLTTSAADDAFGTMPVIDEKYFAFTAYAQDNPESATTYNSGGWNVGAIFVYDYNNTGTDTAPVLIKDTSTSNDYSFFGGTTSDVNYAMGLSNITIRVINSKMFIYAGSGSGRSYNQNGQGIVGIYTYDLSNGPTGSTWSNTEIIAPPAPNPSNAPYHFGLSCGVSDDSIVIGGPGSAFETPTVTQFVQVRSLDSITTTNTTYATVNGTIGLNGGLALGSNADTGTAGQVLVSNGSGSAVSWSSSLFTAYGVFVIPSAGFSMSNAVVTDINTLQAKSGVTPVGMSISSGIITLNNPGTYLITTSVWPIGSTLTWSQATLRDTSNNILHWVGEFRDAGGSDTFVRGIINGQYVLTTSSSNYQFKLSVYTAFNSGSTVIDAKGTSVNVFRFI